MEDVPIKILGQATLIEVSPELIGISGPGLGSAQ